MKTVRYIALRVVLAGIVFLVSALIYQYWFYQSDLENEGWLRLKLERLKVSKQDILYLGASPNASYAPNDSDQRSVMDMVMAGDRSLSVVCYDTGAIHAGFFLDALEWIRPEDLPKTVICELNLRSFGPQWIESDLENSLQRNKVYTNKTIPLWNRVRVSLKNYPWVSPGERRHRINNHFRFDRLPFTGDRRTVFHWYRQLEQRYEGFPGIGGEYVKTFGFVIRENNVRLQQYDAIVAFCKANNIRLVFVLYSENVQEVELTVGNELRSLMQRNVDFLLNRYNGKAETVDCFSLLSPDHWYEKEFVTEHYNAEGRQAIAAELLKQLTWKSGKHSK